MASKAFLVAVAIVATIVAPTLAKEFVVGDDSGWMLKYDYQKWAEGKEFRVGDTLVFNYPAGKHNVLKVNGTDFQSCTKPVSAVPFTTGHDVIPLAATGKKWYICGVANHCQEGPMKLVINVLAADAYSPAPSPTAGGSGSGAMGITAPSLMIAAIVSLFIMIMA